MKPRLKIVHLVTLLELGGAQGNTLFTVNHLNRQKFDVYLWTGKGGILDEEAENTIGKEKGLHYIPHLIRPINIFFDIWALIEITLLLFKIKPDVLHTHSSKAGILGRLAATVAQVPVIIHTYHGFGFNTEQQSWPRLFFIFLEKLTARWTTKLVFVSESNIKTAIEHRIGDPNQYILIRSGVDHVQIKQDALETDKTVLRKSLGLRDGSKIISTVGPFKPQKNLADFVRVAELVVKDRPQAEFLLIGDGELRSTIERDIKQRGLGQNIHLLGWRRDIAELLSISDIFIMTSLWEGLPRSLVEALSLRIPAVCYDTDGVHDLLSIGGGMLVPPKDVNQMARAILNIIDNQKIISHPESLRIKIDSEFEIHEMVRKQEHLYDRLHKVYSSNRPR